MTLFSYTCDLALKSTVKTSRIDLFILYERIIGDRLAKLIVRHEIVVHTIDLFSARMTVGCRN